MTDTHLPWTQKHRPENYGDIQGNGAATDRLKDWLSSWPEDRTPRLLAGPPGVGKTSTIEVLAAKHGYQVHEVNTSSARTAKDVEAVASAINSSPATGEDHLVLLDEVDSWHHATDLRPLYDALEEPRTPVVATCNDDWETPDGLTNRMETEDFKLGKRSRRALARDIAEAEGVDISDDTLETLAERSDARSILNDLQVYGDDLPEESRMLSWSEWDMVDAVMTGTPETGSVSPPDALLWLDENLPHDWRGLELAWGWEALARADGLLGRAEDRGYRHWKYAGAIVEGVAHLRRSEPYYDDNIGRSKEFPEWFRHSAPNATGGSDEAKLYRALTDYDDGGTGLLGSFDEFREVHLPVLRDLDPVEKHELILSERLGPEEYAALDITEAQHRDWMEDEAPEAGEWEPDTEAADAW